MKSVQTTSLIPIGFEIVVAGPSLHSIRSFFGNVFLHVLVSQDPSLNHVYNFDAALPYGPYDLRQLFTGKYPVELHQQTWSEFYHLESEIHRRSIQRIAIPATIETRTRLRDALNTFPNIEGMPTHYTALSANCATLALTCLRLVGLNLSSRSPFIPLLVPWHIREQLAASG